MTDLTTWHKKLVDIPNSLFGTLSAIFVAFGDRCTPGDAPPRPRLEMRAIKAQKTHNSGRQNVVDTQILDPTLTCFAVRTWFDAVPCRGNALMDIETATTCKIQTRRLGRG